MKSQKLLTLLNEIVGYDGKRIYSGRGKKPQKLRFRILIEVQISTDFQLHYEFSYLMTFNEQEEQDTWLFLPRALTLGICRK